MIRKEDCYKIGKITKAHGLKGEVNFMFTDDIWDRTESPYIICEVNGILVPFYMEEYRFRSDSTALVKFEHLDSADADHRGFRSGWIGPDRGPARTDPAGTGFAARESRHADPYSCRGTRKDRSQRA